MTLQKLASELANSKLVKRHITKSVTDPKFLSRTLLITSVSKDVFAYALRVENTLHNDEIPEDKKAFTAKMDAASGLATAVTQIATGVLISGGKFQNFVSDKLFKSLKDNPKALSAAKASFSALSTLVLASVSAKRVVTPLIASKFASYKKDNNDKNPDKHDNFDKVV